MTIEFCGEYHIPAPRQQVWDAINDPAVLQACIAGCSRMEKISDAEMVVTMVATIGPFSATFKGDVVQSNISAPTAYTLTARAHGGALGFGKIEAQVALAEDQDGTVLKFSATAEIGGKLAGVGNWLVQIAAQKTADDFFAAFNRHLSATRVKQV